MHSLDIRTLSFIAMLSSLLIALGLQLVNRVISRDASLHLWAAGATTNALAFVLLALRGMVPDLISIVAGNTLLIAGMSCFYLGNRQFRGWKRGRPWYLVVAALTAAVLYYFTFPTPNLPAQIITISAAASVVLFGAALVLLRSGDSSGRSARWFVGGSIFATAVFMAARAVATGFLASPGPDFMAVSAPIHTLSLVFGIGLNLVLGIGLPLLVSGRIQSQLINSEDRYRTLYTRTPAVMHSIDAAGTLVSVSDFWLRTLGYRRDEVIGRKSSDFLTEDSRRFATEQVLPDFFRSGECVDVPYQFVTRDGRVLDMLLSAIAERAPNGGVVRSLAVMTDVTERKLNQQRLEHLLAEQKAMLESDLIGIITVIDRTILWANPAFERMLGYAPGELAGTPSRQHYPSDEAYLAFGAESYPVLASGKVFRSQIEHMRKDGKLIWVDVSGTMFDRDTGESLWGFIDITERKANEAKIHELAFYDPLTHLPNRRLLLDRLGLALPGTARRNRYGAILFLDLDNFKVLNDTKGHEFGDLLLAEAARRMLGSVRAEDTVARFGGDEFVVMVEDLSPEIEQAAAQAAAIGEKLRAALGAEYSLHEYCHRCSCSIGISLFKGAEAKVGELIKRVDIAMYQAKAAGRNTIRIWGGSSDSASDRST